MLRAEMKEKIAIQRAMIIVQAIMFVVIMILAIMLAKEKSYWQGYNDAYNTGQADGWQSCVEENNLYERYIRNGKE